MKTKNKILTVFLAIIFTVSGCIISKPDSYNVSELDYNMRRTVSGAHFKNKISLIGKGAVIGSAVIGTIVGYNTNMVMMQSNGEIKPAKLMNASIGAFLGYSIASMTNLAIGQNTIEKSTRPEDWLKKTNKNYIILSESSNKNFNVIHKDAEKNFKAKNIQDARDFAKIFPKSSYTNNVAAQTINNSSFTRDNYLELIRLFPNNSSLLDMKKHYVIKSSNIDELFSAYDLFPETNIDIELMAVNFVKDYYDAYKFKQRYPNSKYNKQVVLYALRESSGNQINKLVKLYNNDFFMSEAQFKKLKSDNKIKQNYLKAQFVLKPPKNIYDVEYLYQKFNWLNYYGKQNDIMTTYWNVCYRTMNNGGDILGFMRNLSRDKAYNSWNISQSQVNNFITKKLQYEVQNNVRIVSKETLGTTNDQWEQWCNNDNYTAGLVSNEGEIKYIIYGTIKNESKFNLPINVVANADLYFKSDVQGTGFLTDLLVGIGKYATGQNEISNKLVGNKSENFYIQNLPSKSTRTYAVLLDYGKGQTHGGVNVKDWFKYKEEIYLKNEKAYAQYSTYNPSNRILKKQNEWQHLAKNGLPNYTLTDLYRGGEVDNDVWLQKHKENLRREREAAERARKYRLDHPEKFVDNREAEREAEKIEDVNECIERYSELKYIKTEEEGILNWAGCPCEVWGFESWIGTNKAFYKNQSGNWYYDTEAILDKKGPFNTLEIAIQKICEDKYGN